MTPFHHHPDKEAKPGRVKGQIPWGSLSWAEAALKPKDLTSSPEFSSLSPGTSSWTWFYQVSWQSRSYWFLCHLYFKWVSTKSLQLGLTLCNSMDSSPPGSSVHGILQTRSPEWVAMSSCRGSSWPRGRTRVSYILCIGRQVLFHVTWEALYFKQLQENLKKKQGKLKRLKELSLWIPIHSLFSSPNRAKKDIAVVIHVEQITNSGWNLKGKEKNQTENIHVKMGWDVVGRIWKLENSGSETRLPEFPTQSYCFLTMWP